MGQVGATGAKGFRGQKGEIGTPGVKGVRGDRGLKGVKGDVGPVGNSGPMGIKGETGSQGSVGKIGPAGPQGAEGLKGQKGEPGNSDQINNTSSIPASVNFLFDQNVTLNNFEISGDDDLNSQWIVVDSPQKDLWEESSVLLIEYYVQDEDDSSDWKLEFKQTNDDVGQTSTIGPIFKSQSSSSCQKYMGQAFVPVANDGTMYFKFTSSNLPTISLIRLRVVGFL